VERGAEETPTEIKILDYNIPTPTYPMFIEPKEKKDSGEEVGECGDEDD
jgi:hypothetical protein